MKVLVACEESQRVCIEFRKRGHEAYSCDILECSGGHPEWHIRSDVLKIINGRKYYQIAFCTDDGMLHALPDKWDLIIAHPPCTYLSNAGARHLYPNGVLNRERYLKGVVAADFFMQIYNANCERICVENPVPSKIFALPEKTQIIQPYQFGHPVKKKTYLWLKNLSKLEPTCLIEPDECESTKIPGNWFNAGGNDRQKNRAKTFPGIAKAMAEQWG